MQVPWAKSWWTLVLRGVAAILFGVLTLVSPGISLVALILVFAAYALADGIFNLIGAARGANRHERWGYLIIEGVVSLVAGFVALLWPGLTALALLYCIAAWAVLTGFLEISAAIELRRAIKGEWILALAGVASVAFGVALFVWPAAGALAVLVWIGAYAIVFGCLLVALGIRLHGWAARETRLPGGQTPIPA